MTDADFYASTGYAEAWTRALRDEGAEVERLAGLPEAWALEGPPADRWDLAIPHVLVEEVAAYAPTLKAAAVLEGVGVPLLNPVSALVTSSDKLATHAVWAAHGVAQPRAWDLEALEAWPDDAGDAAVLKPSLCDGARHIEVVRSLDEARAHVSAWRADEARGGERRGTAMLQEWVREPACVRIFATPEATSKAYEKDRAQGAVVTHGTVYPRVYDPPPEMAQLAMAMVGALGGGLMGVDVLVDREGRHLALEANGPVACDVADPGQGRFVARAALARARGAARGPAGAGLAAA